MFKIEEVGEFSGDRFDGIYHVLIKEEADGNISASLLSFPECKGVGTTREKAIFKLNETVNNFLKEVEIIPVIIKSNKSDNPWKRYAGMFKDDPQFDDFLGEIETYRCEVDREKETLDGTK